MLSFFTGIGGKLIGGVIIALVVGGGLTWAITTYKASVLNAAQVSQDRAIAAAVADNQRHADEALAAAAQALQTAQAQATHLRNAYHAVPVTKACVTSPAARAYLNGLRSGANGPGAKP